MVGTADTLGAIQEALEHNRPGAYLRFGDGIASNFLSHAHLARQMAAPWCCPLCRMLTRIRRVTV